MKRFISKMIRLPLTAFVYSMEMFVKTMQGLEKIADQGIDVMMGGIAQSFSDAPDSQSDPTIDATVNEMTQAGDPTLSSQGDLTGDTRTSATSDIAADDDETNPKEERKMPDTDLSNDMLKLVRYKILFVKRDYEVAFPEREELVSDNLTSTAYTGWKIAEFIQNLDEIDAPAKWRDQKYPRDFGNAKDIRIRKLPEDDKKYLRVYFEVLDSYVREQFKYEEDQIDVLKEIRDAILLKDHGGSSAGGGGATSGGGGAAGGGRGTGT
jgi:hypothetical protein